MELGPELEESVRRIAEDQNRSAESVVLDAVREYMQRSEKRRDFIADADAAWTDYKATGLHITGPEMDRWLENWSRVDRVSPTCHD